MKNGWPKFIGEKAEEADKAEKAEKAEEADIIDATLALSNKRIFNFSPSQKMVAYEKSVSAETHDPRAGRVKSPSACDVAEEALSAMARLRLEEPKPVLMC